MAGGMADVGESLFEVAARRSLQGDIDFAFGYRRQSGKIKLRSMEKRIEESSQ